MRSDWKIAVTQLCEIFQTSQNKFDCLRKIDKDMVDSSVSIEGIFSGALNSSSLLLGLDCAHFYIDTGGSFVLRHTTSVEKVPESLSRVEVFEVINDRDEHPVVITEQQSEYFSTLFPQAREVLLGPIRFENGLFALVLFEDTRPTVGRELDVDQDTLRFIQALIGQLSIALRFRHENKRLDLFHRLVMSMFDHDLKPAKCFSVLAHHIKDFLPDYWDMKIDPSIQILTYDKTRDVLMIRGTTGEEPDNTRISVDDSICGLLVRDPKKEYFHRSKKNPRFFLDDPQKYRDRYKSYLGKEAGKLVRRIETEFAFPVPFEGQLVAIINLEADSANAFHKQHVASMLALCEILSPILNALVDRVDTGFDRQTSLAYAMDTYLGGIAHTYRHGMGTPLSAAGAAAESIQKAIDRGEDPKGESFGERIEHLQDHLKQVSKIHFNFCHDIRGFSSYEALSIRKLIDETIHLFSPDSLRKNHDILVTFKGNEDYAVYCSLLLKQHLFNLIDNSIYSVKERRKSDPAQGQILISIDEIVPSAEDQEQLLNKRCKIAIWDNGVGVSEADLARLRLFIPRTSIAKPGGTGFALYAAKDYVTGLGGRIEINSREREWFEMTLTLDIYNPKLHVHTKKF